MLLARNEVLHRRHFMYLIQLFGGFLLIPKICTVLVLAKTSFHTSAEFED